MPKRREREANMALTQLLLLLFCFCCISAANTSGAHGASGAVFNYGNNNSNNSSNKTSFGLSEEALKFLTGPVSIILLPSFYTLVCSISVPINFCAVIVFAWGIRPKKPAAIYMVNLALADLLFALMLPFKISYHFEGNNWKFGPSMCSVVTAAFYWNMYCSVLLIACISVDRLLAVVYPMASLTWRSPQAAVITCIIMWMLSFAGSIPLFTIHQTFYVSELNITTCHDVHSTDKIIWLKTYFLTICCVLFFLPLLITVVSYAQIIWSLSRVQHDVPGTSQRRRRAMVMTLTVLVIFLLCFMPTNCLLLAHYLQFNTEKSQEAPDGSYALYLVFLCLGSLNCLLDPLLYYFGSSQCQKRLSNMVKCKSITQSRDITQSATSSWRFRRSGKNISTRGGSFQSSLRSQNKKLLLL
ncbi:proteinase-activated receptor 1-like isoform X2 [Simochromis diagramma]|uniref:proteinase-activated receptor 1-like isoform X2 n=1 Tax=Simochromis diagramma TaxID=43689 RepID=UPI001A7E90EF|nr:proteinase-activated receptor 1-like isoform X2 [Simochromis diagramma]